MAHGEITKTQHQPIGVREIVSNLTERESSVKLPQRILDSIRRQDNTSEVLVKIIQLTVVFILGVLYLVTPKTDAGTAFSPVPFALGSYLVLNLLGLYWALRRGLPNWAVYGSIVIDIALLMSLIWSFHIQYEQPPSFVLKAPTLLYIFIFIALRALRFEARFVVAAGLMAAIGWSAMILYVTTSNPFDTMITRDYVEYLTSNSILLGAEFDKIVTILIVTGILGLALKRAHTLLVRAVTEQTAANELSRFFDESVATQIRGADREIAAGEGLNRHAAVLNVDIRGFTTMAGDMDAGEVMSLLTEYQKCVVPIVQAHGGTIDKFMGDGIMATFGAVKETDSFAADSLRAVDAVVAGIEKCASDDPENPLGHLTINLAVADGPIAFGAVGDDTRLEYTVIGDAVNLSAKLEKHNKELKSRAVVTRKTYDLALQQGYEAVNSDVEFSRSAVHGTEGASELVVLHR